MIPRLHRTDIHPPSPCVVTKEAPLLSLLQSIQLTCTLHHMQLLHCLPTPSAGTSSSMAGRPTVSYARPFVLVAASGAAAPTHPFIPDFSQLKVHRAGQPRSSKSSARPSASTSSVGPAASSSKQTLDDGAIADLSPTAAGAQARKRGRQDMGDDGEERCPIAMQPWQGGTQHGSSRTTSSLQSARGTLLPRISSVTLFFMSWLYI